MRIAVLDDYAKVAAGLADWGTLGAEVTFFHDTLKDESALVARLAPFDILCVMRERTPLPASLLRQLPQLRLIVTSGPRNLSIDLDAAAAAGITVCGTQSRKTTTSELAMLLLLALARNLMPESQSIAAGGWQVGLGRDLHGLTLGLVGLGNIGQQMAALGRAFGMRICAWSPNLTPARCAELGVAPCPSLPALMAQSDAVSVHMVLSDRTEGLIGPEALASMKPDGMLINTSRGPLVQTGPLLSALRAEPGRRAALDVFDEEPLPADHALRDADLIGRGQLLLTPHLGYVTQATWALFYSQTVEAIAAWQAGNPIRQLTA
ncbi:D-2-hydroxyacid dehydrogenase family protein [Plastorhodobacter daqingensis]|uniref:D-2-hydroxyacid dehydrogenase family protein n=1 Tax=Plastorhodobacter daqingensis TaxID=1387281 RepID=A0ABW2UHP7_9RHOB